MKIIVLLLALVLAFGLIVKQSAAEVKELTIRHEIEQLEIYPNLLPVVEVVAPRS
jgi:hypothetical protein